MILRFHVDIKGNPQEILIMRDKIISALNDLDLVVKRMPDETRVHVSSPKGQKRIRSDARFPVGE